MRVFQGIKHLIILLSTLIVFLIIGLLAYLVFQTIGFIILGLVVLVAVSGTVSEYVKTYNRKDSDPG